LEADHSASIEVDGGEQPIQPTRHSGPKIIPWIPPQPLLAPERPEPMAEEGTVSLGDENT